MDLRSLIVKGMFIIPVEKKLMDKRIDDIKEGIIKFLTGEGYNYRNPSISPFYNFLSLEFELVGIYYNSYFNRLLTKLFKEKWILRKYFSKLKNTKESYPFRIMIYLYLGRYRKNIDGIIVEITSIPTLYYKLTQGILPESYVIDETERSAIIFENTELIKKICHAFHGIMINEPKPMVEFIKTETSQKLRFYGFDKISDLLEESTTKIETGEIKEGLDDLRRVIENFIYELTEKLNLEPQRINKVEDNLKLIKNAGYIDEITWNSIKNSIMPKYGIISDRIHKGERVNLFTARLLIRLIDVWIEFLLESIYHFRISKTSN